MTLLKQYNASAFIMFKSILLSTLRAFFVPTNPLRLVEPRSQLIWNVAVHNSLISFYKIIYKKRIVTLCPNKIYFLENSTRHTRPEHVAKICFVKYFTWSASTYRQKRITDMLPRCEHQATCCSDLSRLTSEISAQRYIFRNVKKGIKKRRGANSFVLTTLPSCSDALPVPIKMYRTIAASIINITTCLILKIKYELHI